MEATRLERHFIENKYLQCIWFPNSDLGMKKIPFNSKISIKPPNMHIKIPFCLFWQHIYIQGKNTGPVGQWGIKRALFKSTDCMLIWHQTHCAAQSLFHSAWYKRSVCDHCYLGSLYPILSQISFKISHLPTKSTSASSKLHSRNNGYTLANTQFSFCRSYPNFEQHNSCWKVKIEN